MNESKNNATYHKINHNFMYYVFKAKNWRIKIEPTRDEKDLWKKVCVSNSNYASDFVTRIIVSDFVLYISGIPMLCQSNHSKA